MGRCREQSHLSAGIVSFAAAAIMLILFSILCDSIVAPKSSSLVQKFTNVFLEPLKLSFVDRDLGKEVGKIGFVNFHSNSFAVNFP